jgi:ABC-type bacteriocin/lantibiotic exporter with double-glycine peptidase domain
MGLGFRATSYSQIEDPPWRTHPVKNCQSHRAASLPCGPGALLHIIQAVDDQRAVRSAALIESDSASRKAQCSLAELDKLAQKCGLDAFGIQVGASALSSVSMPAIAHVEPGHFVALLGVDRERVLLIEPDGRAQSVPRLLFERRFTGCLLCLKSGRRGDRVWAWSPRRLD